MTEVSVLNILLHQQPIASITYLGNDRSVFSFNADYLDQLKRPTLGLRFKDAQGELITDFRPTQKRLMPYFSNLLPEGHLRAYLSARAGVNPEREFFLLQALGADLPGAITVTSDQHGSIANEDPDSSEKKFAQNKALRFSLAGVQLKFSAIQQASGGLTIPASGMGGSWIVKLPSMQFEAVPENEFSMMTLAKIIGIEVPPIQLIALDKIENLPSGIGNLYGQAPAEAKAFAIQRFDRSTQHVANNPPYAIHMEDFAQIFDVYAEDKYKKASFASIARVLAAETPEADIIEFIRRLTFNALIGNADMHLKNWSLIYPDQIHARLAPAYDLVSTIAYIADDHAALNFSRTKRFDGFSREELKHLAAKALLPEKIVLTTAAETVALFHQAWQQEKQHLPLTQNMIEAIEKQLRIVPIVAEV